MIQFRSVITAASIASILFGCGSEEAAPKKTINRVAIPDNSFKPVELEATIGDLVHEIGAKAPEQLPVSVVLKTLTGYWEPVTIGSNRAIGELEVPGTVIAPTETTEDARTARQLAMLQEQRANGARGIGIAPMAQPVSAEMDASSDLGIPVVTIDSDLADSKRDLYIGTINSEAGKTAAQTLLSFESTHLGGVLLLGHDNPTDWPDGYQRTQGAKAALEQAGYTVTVRKTTWTDTGADEDVAYMKNWMQTTSPAPVGMIGLFSAAFRCARAAEELGKTGNDIVIVGFDFEPDTIRYMQSGLMKATHAQRQYYMGYLAPYALYSINVLGLERTRTILGDHMVDESRFNAGLDVVRASQLDEYNDFLDSLGIGG
jgi:ribose transport system substrate-binding protein